MELDPPYLYPEYGSTRLRAPREAPVVIPAGMLDIPGPEVPQAFVRSGDNDLTAQGRAAPQGERIVVAGRVIDADGRPVRRSLIEIWQTNAAGRYIHRADQWPGPLDPNFIGMGRCLTDESGVYRFLTIRPGAYPWRNHENAWRPAHIHFSLFGAGILSRLVTQMYFPGDPLFARDPIFNSIADEAARTRLVSTFDWQTTKPEFALGYRFDIVLRGSKSTPMETNHP